MRNFIFFFALLGAIHTSASAAVPQVSTVTPSSGTGTGQTFTLAVSDSAGTADIAGMNLLFSPSVNGTKACWIYYDHLHKSVYLADDTATTWSYVGVGSPAPVQNSQCAVTFVSWSDAGNVANFAVNVQFGTAWQSLNMSAGIWASAASQSGENTGYSKMGLYNVQTSGPVPDFTVTSSPPSQTVSPGGSATYGFTVTSLNGLTGTLTNQFSFGGFYTPPPGISATQNPPVLTLPANGSVSGTITISTTAETPLGSVDISDWFYFARNNGFKVNLLVSPPSAVTASVSPATGSGAAQTFTIAATNARGFQAIGGLHFLMNSTIDGKNACWFYYQPDSQNSDGSGTLFLASDDANIWNSTSVSAASANSGLLSNSQCALSGGPVTVTGSGNTLTLALPLQFSPLFSGVRNIYSSATDKSGADSGYQQNGSWTVSGASTTPDFRVSILPGPQTVSGAGTTTYGLGLTAVNGFTGAVDFSITGLPANSTLTPAASMTPGQIPSHFSVNTTSATPAGTYTLTVTGTSGTLSHTAQVLLTVQAAGGSGRPLAILNFPLEGSGFQQQFYVTGFDTLGPSNLTGVNLLVNSTVDGRNACWMYYDGSSLWLASDDATVWTHTDAVTPTVQNSQCAVSGVTNVSTTAVFGFSANITFSPGFAGPKSSFVRTANKQGLDTGYQLEGSWTVP